MSGKFAMFGQILWRHLQLPAAMIVIAAAFQGSADSTRAAAPAAGQESKAKAEPRPSQKAVLAEVTVVKRDVAYGEDEKQRLDVYSPQGSKEAPVVVFVHGGEWTKGDKSEVSYKPKFLNENGIVFVSVNYRLAPAATHPAQISDLAAAVRWVRDHAAECGASPDKIVPMGHSAGCHLVTLLALDPRYLAGVKLRPNQLRGVVAWSGGAYDLVQKVADGGTYAPYIRQAFGQSPSAWRDASPVAHVGDARPLPPFLFVSVERGNASHKAAERLAGLIRDAHGRADCALLEGRSHFTANHLLGAPGDTTGQQLLEFLRAVRR
ncbi:MAG: alpha/beta hydrolase [Thermoguttaceae bacterium]